MSASGRSSSSSLGLANKIAAAGNLDRVPAVRETLGRLAALEAMLAGMIHGQCFDHEDLGNGYVAFNRRYMYGALSWCTENYGEICEKIRELMGAGVFLMPADASFLADPALRETFDSIGDTANCKRARPAEALPSRLGSARLRVRCAPHAIRAILCRPILRGARPQLSRMPLAALPRHRRRSPRAATRRRASGRRRPPRNEGLDRHGRAVVATARSARRHAITLAAAPLTTTREALLVGGSDAAFRELIGNLMTMAQQLTALRAHLARRLGRQRAGIPRLPRRRAASRRERRRRRRASPGISWCRARSSR